MDEGSRGLSIELARAGAIGPVNGLGAVSSHWPVAAPSVGDNRLGLAAIRQANVRHDDDDDVDVGEGEGQTAGEQVADRRRLRQLLSRIARPITRVSESNN